MKRPAIALSARTLTRCCLAAGVLGVIASATIALADPPVLGGGCNRGGLCPDVYAPVICSNGFVYSNYCYASRACATGCVPFGDATE